MTVVARAFDVERGDAAVLEELAATGHDLTQPVLLRHVFRVHAGADVEALLVGLAADGYDVTRGEGARGEGARGDGARGDGAPGDGARVTATATVLPTPLSTAQARARMTGLTTRHPVEYLGWEALARRP
jgi:hypothetical protein